MRSSSQQKAVHKDFMYLCLHTYMQHTHTTRINAHGKMNVSNSKKNSGKSTLLDDLPCLDHVKFSASAATTAVIGSLEESEQVGVL